MLTSPITVTIDGVAHSLSRINTDNFGSVYLKKGTGFELRLNIRHSVEGKAGQTQYDRHNVELIRSTFNVDGTTTTSSQYIVIRAPRNAATSIAEKDVIGLNALVTANAAALVAWEN